MNGSTATTASKHSQTPRRPLSTECISARASKSLLESTPRRGIAGTPRGYTDNPRGYCVSAGQSPAECVCYAKHYRRSDPLFLLPDGAAGRVANDPYALGTNRGENGTKNAEKHDLPSVTKDLLCLLNGEPDERT